MADATKRWRLSGANGWGAGLSAGRPVAVEVEARGVVAGRAALALRPAPGGPLDPAALPATLGGLTAPPNVALIGGGVWLASARRGRVLRWNGERMASWIGLPGLGADDAALLDGAGGLVVFGASGGRRVRALHPGAGIVYDEAPLPRGGRLRDLLALPNGEVLLLTSSQSVDVAVWAWRPGWPGVLRRAALRVRTGVPQDIRRLLVDARGRAYVFDRAAGRLLELTEDGGDEVGGWVEVEDARHRFAPLPVAVEPDAERGWRMRVPPRAGTPVPWPAPPACPAFGPDGEPLRLAPEAAVGRRPFPASGTLEVGPLDGALPRTVWDRVELELDALPAGTSVRVSTRTSESAAPPAPGSAPWTEPHRLAGPAEARTDVAVLGAPGRYLWLRLELEGGAATPSVRAATAVYPRRGVADYLPAVFREQDQDTRFLERFVGALEGTWAPLEDAVGEFDRELRPETAGPAMLAYLASWLDQPLDPAWGAAARRAAVRHGAEHLFLRGTPRAVAAALRLHLAARRGVDPSRLEGVPFVWEHFRSRAAARAGGADASGVLFGAEVLRRLRVGSSALGEGTLRDLGSPATDAAAAGAHRFTVFVPRALAPADEDVRALEAVLRREQPAGTAGEIVRVSPRFRVGAQATLGVDSMLGAYPHARLARGPADAEAEGARLDFDCLLADAEPGARPSAAAVGRDEGMPPWRVG